MANSPKPEEFFFSHAGLDQGRVQGVLDNTLRGLDDGELYFQYSLSEVLSFDNGHLKTASFNTSQGFGLRGVAGEVTGFAHSNELTEDAIKKAASTIEVVKGGHSGTLAVNPRNTNRRFYAPENPLEDFEFSAKVKLLEEIDSYLRAKDNRVRQVSASVIGSWSLVHIMRAGGASASDVRPLVRLNVSVVLEKDGRMETGFSGIGGRYGYENILNEKTWKHEADEALRQADVNMKSIPAPAGEMQVVLGNGWPGILLHEAIGHGLEGDFNRKKTSAFAGLMGQQIAAKGITVIDDGTLEKRRGSLTIDDEGTPTEETVLIEDGILKGYLQDRVNARLMGMKPTGNGRRESYAHAPMPRMTNTFMLAGKHEPEEILKSVKDGIYAVSFGGGQVDITNGNFVFSCTEAYRVRDGKVGEPLKGATLIGTGAEVLKKVTMVGNDLELDPGVGTCGKEGQSIPVGVGQPTLLVDGLTVGGTGS